MAILNVKNLPDRLYEKLQVRAKENRRSVAQEVTRILERAVDAPDELSIMELEGLGMEQWVPINAARHVAEERDSWG